MSDLVSTALPPRKLSSRRSALRKAKSQRRKAPASWCAVYLLRDPMTDEVIYVGQTRSGLAERLRHHLKEVQLGLGRSLSPLHKRMAQCLPMLPGIEMLDPKGTWDITEAVWIDRLRREGNPLLNVLSVVPDHRKA